MNRMKRLGALVLAVVMVVSLTACSGSTKTKTKIVGTESLGFVSVPNDWEDSWDGDTYQTNSPDYANYISMWAFTEAEMTSVEMEKAYADAANGEQSDMLEFMTNRSLTNLIYRDYEIYDAGYDMTKIAGKDAGCVYGTYDDDGYSYRVVVWVFENNGTYEFIYVDADTEQANDIINCVEDTFTFTK